MTSEYNEDEEDTPSPSETSSSRNPAHRAPDEEEPFFLGDLTLGAGILLSTIVVASFGLAGFLVFAIIVWDPGFQTTTSDRVSFFYWGLLSIFILIPLGFAYFALQLFRYKGKP